MSYLLSNNLIDENNVTITIENTTPGGSPDALNDLNDQSNIKSGQLEDAYLFKLNGNKLRVTIENIPKLYQRAGIIAVLNTDDPFTSVQSVTCYNNEASYQTSRVSRNIGNQQHEQYLMRNDCYLVDNGNTAIDKVVIDFNVLDSTKTHKIGTIFIGEFIEIGISPNVRKSGKSTAKANQSNGGQFYYTDPVVLRTLDLNISKVTSQSYEKFDNLIVSHGTTQPLMIVDSEIPTLTQYCTFEAIPTFTVMPAKEDGKWLHKANIKVIENR